MEFYIPISNGLFKELSKKLSKEELEGLLMGTKIIEVTDYLGFKKGNVYARQAYKQERTYAECVFICKASLEDIVRHFKRYKENTVVLNFYGKEVYRFSKKQNIFK